MSGSRVMRAIRVSEFGAPSVLQVCSGVGIPQPGHRQVIDFTHAEYSYLRWPELLLLLFFERLKLLKLCKQSFKAHTVIFPAHYHSIAEL